MHPASLLPSNVKLNAESHLCMQLCTFHKRKWSTRAGYPSSFYKHFTHGGLHTRLMADVSKEACEQMFKQMPCIERVPP